MPFYFHLIHICNGGKGPPFWSASRLIWALPLCQQSEKPPAAVLCVVHPQSLIIHGENIRNCVFPLSAKGEASKAIGLYKSFFFLRHEFIFLLHPHSASDSK